MIALDDIRKHKQTVRLLRRYERRVKDKGLRAAVFYMRMQLEGRDTKHHLPKTTEAKISLAKNLAKLYSEGLTIGDKNFEVFITLDTYYHCLIKFSQLLVLNASEYSTSMFFSAFNTSLFL